MEMFNHNDMSGEEEEKPNPNVNFTKLLLISVSFLGMYIALYSAQNVQSVLFEDDKFDSLGFLSNAFAYAGQGTGSVFCVWVIMKIGAIKTMSRFALLNMPFLICLLLPAFKSLDQYRDTDDVPFLLTKGFVYTIIIITSIVNGFAMGFVQPASGNYVADCATEENKGFYFAFFWSFYMGSQIFGSLIAAYVLGTLDQRFYVLIMFGIAFGSALLLFLLKDPVVHHENLHQEDLHSKMSMVSLGKAKQPSLKDGVVKLWNLTKDRRFWWIVPQTLWTGASIAYFSGNLVEMMSYRIPDLERKPDITDSDYEKQDKQHKYFISMLCMISFGFGEVLGCFFIGVFIDKIGSKISAIINVVLVAIMGGITILFL